MSEKFQYIGRFAPSPTGPLHIGSLCTALASFLEAKYHDGKWLVRIEDLDPPRESKDAVSQILTSLEKHQLHWDGEVLFQGKRIDAYQSALEELKTKNLIYPCDCTRQKLNLTSGIYDGCCRRRKDTPRPPFAYRIVTPTNMIIFRDQLLGEQQQSLDDTGDFIIKRKDGYFAYQLAVVVDDAFQEVTHVVRGSDLLDCTARQIYLQQQLGLPTPQYCHTPVICDSDGQKFSKQSFARPIDDTRAAENLRLALGYLQQEPPPSRLSSPPEILAWAQENWTLSALENRLKVTT